MCLASQHLSQTATLSLFCVYLFFCVKRAISPSVLSYDNSLLLQCDGLVLLYMYICTIRIAHFMSQQH